MWVLCGNQKVDAKGGNKMCKLKGRWIRQGIMTCKCKGGCKRGGIMMYKLKRWISNRAL